jgi:hypothetical protein
MEPDLEILLVVHLEEAELETFKRTGKFCCRPERQAPLIREFCQRRQHFAYTHPFVSIAVYESNESPCESPATTFGDSGELRKNQYVILRPEKVVDDIEVVAMDDLLNLADAMARRWKRNEPYGSLLNQIRDLRNITFEQRLESLKWATRNKNVAHWAEARLNRCLTLDDVQEWKSCDDFAF